ncbi:condensation domain-containing protein [Microseira wollei]|uniref:Condensation domain-containing protein n=1 Tax=Microseira wollei NIES-4236 TaxID=2530354 RepID=A0AAV3X6J4_9CYAN|nr:condensation domain-containing protein [Microseira wollei]GET36206.1 condensation domain-containing protein [Microseira wollei NIES-4236]
MSNRTEFAPTENLGLLKQELERATQAKYAPLSLAQERLWFHEQSVPGSSIYNIPVAYTLTGRLNLTALEQSLREIVQRHEVLRTTFSIVNGQPIQLISPEVEVTLPLVDLQKLPPQQRQAQAQQLAQEEAQQPFDLISGPLCRFKLLRKEEGEHLLLVTVHHIISDRWSLVIFMQELATLYEAFLSQKSSPLADLPKQYADFAISQREWIEGKKWESQLAYWQQQLTGNVPPLELPIDQERPLIPTYRGARQSVTIGKKVTEELKKLSAREETTLFMTLLAAFQMLLYQYTKQEDMLICSPIAGRHRFQTKDLIGYFINIVPLRTNLGGDPNFGEILGQVRQVVLGAYRNLDLPFQAIADLPNLARTPLTRGFFALQPAASQTPDLPGVKVSFQDIPNGTANFDFSLCLEETGETLTGFVDYKIDLFDGTTITQMLEHFQRLLESLVADREQRLSSLPSLRETQLVPPKKTELEATYVAPQKEIERTIAIVWQEVLQIEKVGIHHNFFDLGGQSLAIARVVGKLQEIFHRKISVVDLFQYPTISAMSQYLSQEDRGTTALKQIQNNAQRQKQAIARRKQLMQQRTSTH